MIGQEFYHKYRKNIPINYVYYNFNSFCSEKNYNNNSQFPSPTKKGESPLFSY